MKKIIFLTHNKKKNSDGVWKKIRSQVNAFVNIGYDVDFFYLDEGGLIWENVNNNLIRKYALKFRYGFYLAVRKLIAKEEAYDFAYIRKPHGGFFSLCLPFLLSSLKKERTIIMMEIPTYPYDLEIRTFKEKVSNYAFLCTLPFFKNNLDKVLYMGDLVDNIWGLPCQRIGNGIDVNAIKKVPTKKTGNCFVFVGVGHLAFWHGFDRLILGMKEYKGDREIIFKIVGGGEPELNRLKTLAHDLKNNKVIFEGVLSGECLYSVLESADVCVDSLGRHRSGNNCNNSLKSKEYCARGLPFIKSHIDYSFGAEEFIYQVNADESAIDINSIIAWRESLSDDFSSKERCYAERNLTWETQFLELLGDK
ncbi:glycosyltransferase [Citrobacter freundii]|uniref:glycosyltransferase n=1 Tax=Citrobacter freundii TaxID=546 RepID=UPI00404350AE